MKKLLHIIPYSNLYPPSNGGQLRCFHLMHELSSYFETHVILYQNPETIYEKGYRNENITFFSPDSMPKNKSVFDILPKKIGNAIKARWITKSFKTASKEVLEFTHLIKNLGNKYKYDYIITEHHITINLADLLKKYNSNAKLIFDAHNVDYILLQKETSIGGKNISPKIIQRTKKIESGIYKYYNYIIACSKIDLDILLKLNKNKIKGFVVPNGVDTEKKIFIKEKQVNKTILFCGSLEYTANKEGLLWFYEKIWEELKKEIPEIKLIIAGSGNNSEIFGRMKTDKQIEFKGFLEKLDSVYNEASVSIVPLNLGSGTRLKILESMSYGLPVVSTKQGAEGVQYPPDTIIIADNPDYFGKGITDLLTDKQKFEKQRHAANIFVKENFDWENIITNLVNEINTI